MPMTRRGSFAALTLALGLATAGTAQAQDKADVAAAKKEGKVVWYTSTPVETGQKIAKLFEEKYGIRVEMFRSGGSAILRRFLQENQAKRVNADVLTTSDPAAATELGEEQAKAITDHIRAHLSSRVGDQLGKAAPETIG